MTLQGIEFDRANLTLMGVKFPNLEMLETTATAFASNMYEGFKPTPKLVSLYLDYIQGKVSHRNLVKEIKNAIV